MAVAGFNSTIEVSTDGGSIFNPIGGTKTVSQNLATAMLDITQLGDSAMNRIAGLLDVPSSVGGDRDDADTGQAGVISTALARGSVVLRYLYDGTRGFSWPARVEDMSFETSVDGIPSFSYTFASIGVPTQITA